MTDKPEFDLWRWVDFWYPATHVVTFKRSVYQRALRHLAPLADTCVDPTLADAFALAGEMAENAFSAAENMAEHARSVAESMVELADQLAEDALAKTA